MQTLISYPKESRNEIIDNIELVVDSTSEQDLIQIFACKQIYGPPSFDNKLASPLIVEDGNTNHGFHQITGCPFCCLSKNHVVNHYLQ